MNKNRIFTALSIFWLILASLASCIGGPEPIPTIYPTDVSLDQQIQAAQTAVAPGGNLTLTISDSQLASWLALKLDTHAAPFMYLPIVSLKDGKINIDGYVGDHGHTLTGIKILLVTNIDAEGTPVIAVTLIKYNPSKELNLPEGMEKTISAFVAEAFTDMLDQATSGYHIESITIADRLMTLTGRAK